MMASESFFKCLKGVTAIENIAQGSVQTREGERGKKIKVRNRMRISLLGKSQKPKIKRVD